MPRKPRRHLLNSLPLTFSPFARSAALAAHASSTKKQIHEPEYLKDTPHNLKGNLHAKSSPDETIVSSDEDFEGIVQADFAFFDPKADDFHGVKILLQTYLDDKQWDLSGFVDLILGQTSVGTVVKIEGAEDDGIFSFVSALNLGRYKAGNPRVYLRIFIIFSLHGTSLFNNTGPSSMHMSSLLIVLLTLSSTLVLSD
ncbi:hypothetical protein SAY86_026467 [Trapa natans]|uniref:Protein BCCIP homolog n=1 Tax=Trapa natans TaxID=22666 RepID=A0AAN7QEK8_TRANT|nr:hypothetical protein SAY86_026467 [Trapa natans]